MSAYENIFERYEDVLKTIVDTNSHLTESVLMVNESRRLAEKIHQAIQTSNFAKP